MTARRPGWLPAFVYFAVIVVTCTAAARHPAGDLTHTVITRALGFLKPSLRLARARALMKFSHFDSDATVARRDANVRLINWFDLTGWRPTKGTAHLLDQSHFFVLLDLPSH